jgi:hypothetical protein
MHRHAVVWSLLAIALVACSDNSVTAPSSDVDVHASRGGAGSSPPHTRDLRGRCATTFTFTSPPGPAQQLHIDGNCVHAPMGRLTASSEQLVVINPADGSSTITNTTTYTAPNGDQIFATFVGTGDPPDATGTICFEGTETYAGGTGRFTGATGSADISGCASLATQTGFFDARGTIRY